VARWHLGPDMLRCEVGKPPVVRGKNAELLSLRQFRTVREDELPVLRKDTRCSMPIQVDTSVHNQLVRVLRGTESAPHGAAASGFGNCLPYGIVD